MAGRKTVSPERVRRSGLTGVPRQRTPATAILGVRKGSIYAFPIWETDATTGLVILYRADPATGLLVNPDRPRRVALVASARDARRDAKPRIVWDYVGQTIREVEIREAEHVDDKPWADVIAGRPVVVAEGLWDCEERDRQEIAAIHRTTPRFNHEHNLQNPKRVEIWRQIEHRHARDDAGHRPRWIPEAQRGTPAELGAAGHLLASWPRPLKAALVVLAGWAGAGSLLAEWMMRYGIAEPVALLGAAAAGVLLLAILVGRPRSRRRRRLKRWLRQ